MKTIQVVKDFLLTLDSGVTHAFKAGVHIVEDEIAAHWYVKTFSTPVAASAPPVTPEPPPAPPPAPAPDVAPEPKGKAK
jgi:hypothetical protein